MLFLSVYVVPKFTLFLKGRALPPMTRMMLDYTGFIQAHWTKIVGGMVATAVAVPVLKKTVSGALIVDWIFLKIPIVGKVIQSGVVVNFARNLSILLKSGVPLSDAVLTVRDTLKNAVAARVLDRAYEGILAGEGMADTIRKSESVFPPMVGEMVATGEETGEMVKVLELTAQIVQKMLESFVKRMNSLIEPMLIMVLGGMVGFVIVALMMGVLSMYSSIK
jgi:type II secretory pathway component PulF